MGDYFQYIVDVEATEEQAPQQEATVRDWLLREGIISAEMTDCVLGSELGYPPTANYTKAVEEPDDFLLERRTNGVKLITKRTIFDSGQGGFELICSSCDARFEYTDEWSDAVHEWSERRGPGIFPCPHCGHAQPLTEWKHDPPWAYADFGIKFWNWPPLTTAFVDDIARLLGHRVVVVAGKL